MVMLNEHTLKELADLIWRRFASGPSSPGAEYSRIRSFFMERDLVPPTLAFPDRSYWDSNVARTKNWLIEYLADLNKRRAQGTHFAAGIERVILALLEDATARDHAAAVLEKLFDPIGVRVSWNTNQQRYELVAISAGQPASEQPVPHILYDYLDLHPVVRDASSALFKDQHYAQAVFEACKVLENMIKEKLLAADPTWSAVYGKSLMAWALGDRKPFLRVNTLTTETDQAEHEGYKLLLIGAALAIRNPLAHKVIEHDPYQALEYLAFVSLLAKRVDAAKAIT